MEVIILALDSGLQVWADGEPMTVKGYVRDIPNETESWRRILDNLNVAPSTLHLKIIWNQADYKLLQHCQEIFSSLASLEIEMLSSLNRRLENGEINGENFKECFNSASTIETLQQEKKFIGNKLKKLQAVLRDRK